MYGTHMYKLYHKQLRISKRHLTFSKVQKKVRKSLNYRKESQLYLMKN